MHFHLYNPPIKLATKNKLRRCYGVRVPRITRMLTNITICNLINGNVRLHLINGDRTCVTIAGMVRIHSEEKKEKTWKKRQKQCMNASYLCMIHSPIVRERQNNH